MSSAAIWAIFIVAGMLTFLTRLSFISLLGRVNTPIWLSQVLRFVPPAVLSAIIFSDVLIRDGQLSIAPSNLRLVAALIAALVAWRSKNALLTIGVGMAALWLLRWWLA